MSENDVLTGEFIARERIRLAVQAEKDAIHKGVQDAMKLGREYERETIIAWLRCHDQACAADMIMMGAHLLDASPVPDPGISDNLPKADPS